MSEIRYTPGPWLVDGPPWNQIVWSSSENRVCFLAHSNGLDGERDIATGRLISAAPDLLEAAKVVRSLLAEHYPNLIFNGHASKLDAAIAKAEGRS